MNGSIGYPQTPEMIADYERKVFELEALGLTTSDAQAFLEAQEMNDNRATEGSK